MPVYMCRVLPKPPCPDCEAPLLYPICRFRWPSFALNWSSVNSRLLASAIFGPSLGPSNSGCFWVILPKEYKQRVTCGIFLLSNRSAVWKISSSGTPYFFIAAWNLWMFSINWKLVPFVCIFLTDPGASLLTKLQRTTPSRRTSSYGWLGSFSPRTASIHSMTSVSCSLFRPC